MESKKSEYESEKERFKRAVGCRIRELRQSSEEKYTQEKLSEKIWGSDNNGKYLGNIERGEKDIQISTLKKIVDALDISLAEFFKDMKFD